ncbi:hypothetical protein H3T48_02610 [Lactobacillus sp. M0403]|uniref:hypothetical protein n=1 Tax=Lactobacillus sp. M0403 TaxID=2751031 RepID=UPI0018DD5167|nr:hypothetical protein [Lactobacillus sp. M0403]MBI0092600.1 hypothetical protein [Lactobacillus sp. M0403]
MAYFELQFKKVFKNTLTWLILSIVLICAGLILGYNALKGDQTTIRYQINQDLSQQKQPQANLPTVKNQNRNERQILKALDNKNWGHAYELMIRQNDKQAAQVKIGGADLRQEIKQKNARLNALKNANLPEQNEQHPKQGWLFLFKLSEGFLPAMIVAMLCFILSNIFASKYVDHLNRAILLPSKHSVLLDIILGLLIAFSLTLFISLLIWGLSSLLFGSGPLSYPIQGITLPGSFKSTYQPLSVWLKPAFILTVLTCIFIVILLLLLAQITRNQLSCLFLALFILLGGAILPFILQSTSGGSGMAQTTIVQYIPMTYLLSTQVANGNLAIRFNNPQLNFTFGCKVLMVSIIILTILNFLWPWFSKQMAKLTKG